MTSVTSSRIIRVDHHGFQAKEDLVVVEEPLEIRLGYGPVSERIQKSIAITMRTPGHDFELALGFLFSEGIIDRFEEINSIDYCVDVGKQDEKENVVRVELKPEISPDLSSLERNFYMTSSCGVCGKSSIESVLVHCEILENDSFEVSLDIIHELPGRLGAQQTIYEHTGGLHACGIFNVDGEAIKIREDIGRHNALDKLIGSGLINGRLPFKDNILVLSGRAGFELIQKAARAGISIIAAVGAPSSLSLKLAKDLNITLIGFLKSESLNIYSGEKRIIKAV